MSTKQKKKRSGAKSNQKSIRQESLPTKIIPMPWMDFHVFQWVCHSEEFDVDRLVAQAVANAEGTEESVTTHLNLLLEEQVKEWEHEWVQQVSEGLICEGDDVQALAFPDSAVDPSVGYADLVIPILMDGWERISTWRVAEAILRQKGMWRK